MAVIETIKVEGADEAVSDIQKVQNSLEKFNKGVNKNRDATRLLDKATGGAVTKFQDLQKGVTQGIIGVKGLAKSFKGLRVAIAATGIGLIVVALATIVEYWDDIIGFISGATKEQERLAAQLERTKIVLNNETNLLRQQLSLQELKGESTAQTLIDLRKSLLLQQAIAKQQLEEQVTLLENQKIRDEELSFFDKLKASFVIKKDYNYQEELALIQQEKRNVKTEEQVILEDKINKLKTEGGNIDKALATLDSNAKKKGQKEIDEVKKTEDEKFKILQDFLIAKEKLEDEYFQSKLKKEEQEKNVVKDKYFNLIEQAKKFNEDITVLEQARDAELQEVQEKFKLEREEKKKEDELIKQEALIEKLELDKEFEQLNFDEQREILNQRSQALLNDETLTEEQKTQLTEKFGEARVKITELENKTKEDATMSYANALGGISNLIGAETQAGKLAASAAALIATYLNANKARESQLAIPTPDAPFRAALAAGVEIVSGLANVKAINSVQVPKAGGGGGSNPTAPTAPPALPPAFNVVGQTETSQLSDTIASQTQEPVQAFVVANDVTTAQSLQRNIVQGATI